MRDVGNSRPAVFSKGVERQQVSSDTRCTTNEREFGHMVERGSQAVFHLIERAEHRQPALAVRIPEDQSQAGLADARYRELI